MSSAVQHTVAKSLLPDDIPVIDQNDNPAPFVASRKNYLMAKRCFDVFFSVMVILFLLSWLTPLLALAIKINSRGPVFFRQKRTGRDGKHFYCIKFRTMILNDEADQKQAEENDKRITATGKFLRITNLDELPQFFNVLIGNMSVVGPRPHMISDCMRFSFIIPSYSFRNLVRPGITGWAQVNGHHGPALDRESVIERYYWDARYVAEVNAVLDLKIMLRTIWKISVRSGRFLLSSPLKTGNNTKKASRGLL